MQNSDEDKKLVSKRCNANVGRTVVASLFRKLKFAALFLLVQKVTDDYITFFLQTLLCNVLSKI